MMGRVLGVDVGTVRVGLAVSDPGHVLAQPLSVCAREGAEEEIARQVAELDVERIVVGLPIRTDGSHGPEAEAATAFAKGLEQRCELPVEMWDERLSTKQAEAAMRAGGTKAKGQRGKVDKVAAALVLQAFLDHAGRR